MFTLKTTHKIALAHIACSIILSYRKILGKSNRAIVKRDNIWWDLDLTEGIDFSIYLLGGFEPVTLNLYKKLVKPGNTVLDIGANIGSHTLPLARLVGDHGQVIAFEPTRFAIEKMASNIALNKDIATRISVRQDMLVANEQDILEKEIYSSWPLFGHEKNIHEEHRGKLMGTEGAVAVTLDKVISQMGITRIDLIKLDVDGHEYSVLAGGKTTLSTYRPTIVMELAPYLFDPSSGAFEKMISLFASLNYAMLDANTGKMLTLNPNQLRAHIPVGGTRNVLLKPI